MFLAEIPNTVSRGGGRERIPPATKTVETTCQRLFRDVLSRNVVRGIAERARGRHLGNIANTHARTSGRARQTALEHVVSRGFAAPVGSGEGDPFGNASANLMCERCGNASGRTQQNAP